ncbi:response regulator transcription factor [Hymenobacter sp. H14-R3]|uniref:response regulator n=1 Tax=Hymenobacter sp. H14-R3 TaxID=3046308 RepID=UPI0024BA7DBB|nr:response regulator transcription factor [Hymenobacter sp. H14-R3]MDJ0366163.1 response regulator transcription factor [Hymenobacter sp. H14-R3]
MITLGIIEDQAAIREALFEYLGAQPEFDCVLCAASHEEFMAALPALAVLPTLVLSDIGLPGRSGIEGLSVLRQVLPQAEVLMLSVYTDAERVFEALRAGAVGYLEKTTPLPLLKEHLLQVAAGGSPMSPSVARHVTRYFAPRPTAPADTLTARERDIVRGIEDGLSYKSLADRLHLSIDTVRSHIRQVYRKLQVNSKSELMAKTRQRPLFLLFW